MAVIAPVPGGKHSQLGRLIVGYGAGYHAIFATNSACLDSALACVAAPGVEVRRDLPSGAAKSRQPVLFAVVLPTSAGNGIADKPLLTWRAAHQGNLGISESDFNWIICAERAEAGLTLHVCRSRYGRFGAVTLAAFRASNQLGQYGHK